MNTVLYPFVEEAFCEETEGAVTEICKLGRSGTVNPMFIVNRHGRITDLFKRERVSFFELGIKRLVGANDFYLKTLFRLFSSSMPLFIFCERIKSMPSIFMTCLPLCRGQVPSKCIAFPSSCPFRHPKSIPDTLC